MLPNYCKLTLYFSFPQSQSIRIASLVKGCVRWGHAEANERSRMSGPVVNANSISTVICASRERRARPFLLCATVFVAATVFSCGKGV